MERRSRETNPAWTAKSKTTDKVGKRTGLVVIAAVFVVCAASAFTHVATENSAEDGIVAVIDSGSIATAPTASTAHFDERSPEPRAGISVQAAALPLMPGPANQLGANFNSYFQGVDYTDLQKAGAHWARLFLPMPSVEGNVANIGVVRTALDLYSRNDRTVLNLKWNFSTRDFPKPNTAAMADELSRVDAVLPSLMNKIDVLVVGNEPYIEARDGDKDADLNIFYETMAKRVISYRAANCAAPCRTHIYMGAFNRLDLPENITPSTDRWMQFVKATSEIDGVDIHPHVETLQATQPFLNYILPRMRPDQKFTVTEFSLVHRWQSVLANPIATAFADKYGLPRSTQNWEVIRSAIDNRFPKQKWDDFLAMSPWFNDVRHYLVNVTTMFRNTGHLAVATYDFEQGQAMAEDFVGPTSAPWIINPVFAPRTVVANPDGSNGANYAWLDDFKTLQVN